MSWNILIFLSIKTIDFFIINTMMFSLFLASLAFLGDTQPHKRKPLAVYPICLFYLFISWMVVSHNGWWWWKRPESFRLRRSIVCTGVIREATFKGWTVQARLVHLHLAVCMTNKYFCFTHIREMWRPGVALKDDLWTLLLEICSITRWENWQHLRCNRIWTILFSYIVLHLLILTNLSFYHAMFVRKLWFSLFL